MVVIENVAVVGASGNIGAPVLKAIIDSGKFNVTVLTRIGSKSSFPSSVQVIPVDYSSVKSLTAALKGQDAVVSTVGNEGLADAQAALFDASVAAGVKRFLPSEFGSDLTNPKTASLPVFGHKVATRNYIEEKVKAGADITYTYAISGPFLDWGIEAGFLLDWKEGKPRIYDGGDRLFSATSLASIGLAVVGILSHYEETKNRSVRFQDIAVTQNQFLAIAKRIAPEKQWAPVPTSTADMYNAANAALAKGDYSVMYDYIIVGIFQEGYAGHLENIENELLGVPGKTEADIEAIFKKLLT